MSDSPTRRVSIELELDRWRALTNMHTPAEQVDAILGLIEAQLPVDAPAGAGAIVRAIVNSAMAPSLLVHADGGPAGWRDVVTGRWFGPDEFRVQEVHSEGVPWPA